MTDSPKKGNTDPVRPRDRMGAAELLGLGESEGGPEPLPSPEQLQANFPQYEILELIGHGGMGAVYKAKQKALDRLIAIKLLPTDLGEKADFAARFEREARAMARLNHPNIVTVFDYGQTLVEGRLWFAMEFVDGRNLGEVIRSGELTPARTLTIAAQLCDALAYAHAEGVVHRDIKPANVLVDSRDRVKVADFGLVRMIGTKADASTLTMTGTVMGTLDYMAPEQRIGMEVDHRADIYSVGVILYEMFCRERPQGVFTPPSKRTGCDSRIDEIVHRALQQEPTRRYERTEEMKAAVDVVRDSTAPLPLTKRGRRQLQILAITALVLAIAGISYATYAYYHAAKRSKEAFAAAQKADPNAPVHRALDSLATLNPGFEPKTTLWRIENGAVVEMTLNVTKVKDLSPLRTLTSLKKLQLGRPQQRGATKSLEGLRGLKLEWLECHYCPISDLSPISGMPLKWLVVQGSDVADLTPIKDLKIDALGINETRVGSLDPIAGMPIRYLNCGRTQVNDISPLAGSRLIDLNISETPVRDLEPLRGMQLTRLICDGAPIEDYSVIKEMPLRQLELDFDPAQHTELLRSMSSLIKINKMSVSEFWRTR